MMIVFIVLLALIVNIFGASLTNCPSDNLKFEKVLGLRPSENGLLLLKSNNGAPITEDCVKKCQDNEDCRSFVLFYDKPVCYWYKATGEGADQLEAILDTRVAWFMKTCLEVNSNCSRLWVFERVPGAILIGNDTKQLPEALSRAECQQYCLNESDFTCRSFKYKIIQANYGPNGGVTGVCTLSDADRHLLPNSYRVSGYDEEYFENQCVPEYRTAAVEAFCAYEEYDGVILSHTDVLYGKKTKEECQQLCEDIMIFNCRGYSIEGIRDEDGFRCHLHSEDSKVHGPKLLMQTKNAKYYERARCLNVSVTCTKTDMTVTYVPELNFSGKIYMQGYVDNPECFAIGKKRQPLELKIPLQGDKCGVIEANGPNNRTLKSGTMILQYNTYIQTQGDRVIRVGCIFGNSSKTVVASGITISPDRTNHSSAILNSTSEGGGPMVMMKIVDLQTQKEVSETQVGQELQLIIEVIPADSPFDLWAGHLVAMTEKTDTSILLLDDRGCPVNLKIFPPLKKIESENSKRLEATFQAFKFYNSPVVRFSVIVQFCPDRCPTVDCGNNVRSYGRRRRSIATRSVETINATKIHKIDRSQFETKMLAPLQYEMPLQFTMFVRDSEVNSDRLLYGDDSNRVLVAGYKYSTNEVCLDYSLFVGLIVTWILIQVIFLICCIVLVKRYKRYYRHESMRQSLEELHKNFGIGFSNLDNRRVHWADNPDFN